MRNIYTGIDLGSDNIKIVIGEFLDDKMNILASTNVRSSGIRKGVVVDKELAMNSIEVALNEIEPSIGVKIEKAILSIPGNKSDLSIVSGNSKIQNEDGVDGEDILTALQNATIEQISSKEDIVNIIPITYSVDDGENVVDPRGLKGEYLEVKAVLAPGSKKEIRDAIEVLSECGIEVIDIILGSIGDYYEAKTSETQKSLGAIVNIGSETMDISIFNKGIIIKQDKVDLGSKNIDKDISYVYGVDLTTSRTLKENFAVCSRRYADVNDVLEIETKTGEKVIINQYEISEVVESRVIELLKLAKKQINHLTKRKISYIIVTGGITELTGFNYVVENILGMTATTMNATTIGIRNNKYSSVSGIVRYFYERLQLRDKYYSMFDELKCDEMLNNKNNIKKSTNDNIVSKVFGYFTGN